MAFSDKLTVVIDFVTGPAQSGLGKMRSEVAKAEGAFGKMKAAGNVAFDSVKANAANFAMAAGSALVAFGIKSVKAFQDTALAAGQFSDATGVSVQEASRLAEVASGLGIEIGSVQGAMQRMEKALGTNKSALAEYGVEVVRAKDGTVDANATFIEAVTTIGKIEDPTKRAEAAQKAFGKSYGDIAQLMGMSAEELRSQLASVSDEQVIDPEEVAKARKYRDAMDALNDSLAKLALTAGENLVPAVAQAATGLSNLIEIAEKTSNSRDVPLEMWIEQFGSAEEALRAGVITADEFASTINEMASPAMRAAEVRAGALADSMTDLEQQTLDAEAATALLDDTYARLKGTLDEGDALDKAAEATWNFRSETDRTEAEVRDYVRALADTVTALDKMPDEQKTNLLLQLEEGDYAAVEAALARYRLGVDVPVRFKGQGSVGFEKRAAGGPVNAGQPYLVGEKGPEIVVPGRSGTVIPNNRIGGSGGGVGSPTVVNIYPRALPTDRELIDLVTNLRRRNGGVI